MMITLITLFMWIIFLLNCALSLDNYTINNRMLNINRGLFKSNYQIPVDQIIKVYPTKFPDELVTLGSKYSPSFFFDYVQIEFKHNSEWQSTYITSSYPELFSKQIGVIQQNKAIHDFIKFIPKIFCRQLFLYCLITITVSIIFDIISMTIYFFAPLWFIIPIVKFIFVKRRLNKIIKVSADTYIMRHLTNNMA